MNFMYFEYIIGKRYFGAKQKEAFVSLITLLSVLGVTVGVMVLIVVIAVMSGFESELMSRILGIEAHILVGRYGEPISEPQTLLEKIQPIEGVETAAPFIYAQAMLRSASGVSGAAIRGIDIETTGCRMKTVNRQCFDKALARSESENSQERMPGLILGKVLAEKLKVAPGDIIYLISSQGSSAGKDLVPEVKRIRVLNLFETGMNEYDGAMAYLSLQDAQAILHMGTAVTGIEVRIGEIYAAKALADKIVGELGFPFWTRDWMQMNKNLFSMLKLQKVVMFIILTLIVLVAAFNIASALIMMVMEKTRDIAILKAMGATDRSIRRIFVFKGMVIGLLGTMAGLILGVLLCALLRRYQFIQLPGDVYFLTTLPVRLEIPDLLTIMVATLGICFLATLYPARQASRFNPVEGIRFG
jgi:lipoprotein-releasing system permease protein